MSKIALFNVAFDLLLVYISHLRHLRHALIQNSICIAFDPLLRYFYISDISDMNTVYKATLSKVSKVLYRNSSQWLPCYLIQIGSICNSKK